VSFAARLQAVEERIRQACARSGRPPSSVKLVGVSKRQPLALLRQAAAAGLTTFGESQVQEAQAKAAELPVDLDWHLIGPLQSNKVKRAVRLFGTIHSVDRLKIARLLDREARAQGRILHGFLQINLAAEPTKRGFAVDDLAAVLEPCAAFEALHIVGLMALPPYQQDPQDSRPWFRQLRELRDELVQRPEWHQRLPRLSMGMSHDFEVAIAEGASHIRVGTTLFGNRLDEKQPAGLSREP